MRKSIPLAALAISVMLGAPAEATKYPCHASQNGEAAHACFVEPASKYTVFPNPFVGHADRCITDEGYGRWSYCDSN